jgi:hypothetical protein
VWIQEEDFSLKRITWNYGIANVKYSDPLVALKYRESFAFTLFPLVFRGASDIVFGRSRV